MKLPLNNKKSVVIAILVLIALFAGYKTYATEIGIGATYTGEFNGGMAITLAERVLDGKMDIGIAMISEQTFKEKTTSNNGNVFVNFVATKPEKWWRILPSEVLIGSAYWIKTDDRLIGSQLGYKLGIKWRFGQLAIGFDHWSNAGTVKPNRGQDLIYLSWSF